MTFRKALAPTATLGNAASGFLACSLALTGHPELAALMILAAVLLDSFDGALARSLGSASRFGAELDSLADVISFGVAPALLVASLIVGAAGPLAWLMVTAYPLCTVWRLARFTAAGADGQGNHREFHGLPSTGAGGATATAVLMHLRLVEYGLPWAGWLLPPVLLLLALLMVSTTPYKHAGAVIARLNPAIAAGAAVLFVGGSILWDYEFMFGALMWSYALSGPLVAATVRIRALRHA